MQVGGNANAVKLLLTILLPPFFCLGTDFTVTSWRPSQFLCSEDSLVYGNTVHYSLHLEMGRCSFPRGFGFELNWTDVLGGEAKGLGPPQLSGSRGPG